jgi:hypothetical protein
VNKPACTSPTVTLWRDLIRLPLAPRGHSFSAVRYLTAIPASPLGVWDELTRVQRDKVGGGR